MNDLVVIKNNLPVISTFDLFSKMGYREHRKLKLVISSNIDAFNDLGFLPLERAKPTSATGGRPVESYLLNEDHFILLVLLAKNSPESVTLKIRVSKEFKRMKQTLANIAAQQHDPDRQKIRADGKAIYHQKSDVIKNFVEYAKSQGSTSAELYYSNLARMENNALFFIEAKYKNLREIMTIRQLMQVATADQAVERALQEGMDKGLHCKECFVLAKERVIAFAEIIGKSQLHDLALEVKKEEE